MYTIIMLTIPCIVETLQNRVLSTDGELLGGGREEVGVTSNELALGKRSKEPDGLKELGKICDDIVDSDDSDPM